MNKIKIMHIVQSPGGVARYLSMYLKYSDKNRFEHILICSLDYKMEKMESLVEHIEYLSMGRQISIINDAKGIWAIRKFIKKYMPDVIYAHSSKAGALGRLADVGFKNIVLYNPHGWAFNMNDISAIKKKVYALIEKVLSYKTDMIIAISAWEKESAAKYKICCSDKIHIIPSGVDVCLYDEKQGRYDLNRSKLNIPVDAYVIGMVGRISYGKGPDLFVKAAALIKNKIPNAFFVIVGEGEERSSIENLLSEMGLKEDFLITGWVSNPMEYIQLFDQAMLLTRWEGFGLVLTEYMLAEKPIITTRVGAVPDLMQHGKNGVMIDVGDIERIAEASYKLYTDNEYRQTLVSNGRLTVRNRYDVRCTVKEHERLLMGMQF
ncbi:glycosyltransferase family 4 protein [Bacteroides caccae]|jgi:eps4F|uniref:glycosyltransferase family 4 protein n=1 Tax=Bacteroides caccae TaxID=47678 RepID=UPI001CCB43D0|nr:glycosyltransferase family 4 protein [Bacteroides caccae]UBF13911.1 glycosyltransferase family 4 protein [Bacteroides caccae]UVP80471.1 glycosyltransferase family 4 protein [Bacteroides caccae]UVQ05362.1 glycosyltransferase family 4 protein [Bacteroides caccae]